MKYAAYLLQNEVQHFKKLHKESKIILVSIFLFNLVSPILSTFINAFLWRSSQDVMVIILYNIALFFGTPLGFYLNGQLLKKNSPTTFYFIGSILQGLTAAILLFFSKLDTSVILFFGIIQGIAGGIYWGNRVFLVANTVKSNQRMYFTSLVFMQSTLCSIVLPFFIGWYLVIGERTHFYSADSAYKMLGGVLILGLLIAGMYMKTLSIDQKTIPYVTLKKPSKAWKKIRLMTFLMGITNSIDAIFPIVLVLQFVGKEGKLGTIQALSGILLAIAMYQIGKKVNKNIRFFVLVTGVFLSIIAGALFSITYSSLGVIFYFILAAFASPFKWTVFGPVMFDVMDGEVRKYAKNRYAFVFDQEFFLNLGRNFSLILFILLYMYTPTFTLRFTPLIFALPQLYLLYLTVSVERYLLVDYVKEKVFLYNYTMVSQQARVPVQEYTNEQQQ